MSSKKRLNENAQIQKEEYDARVENATEQDAVSFQRATKATLKQRRIIQLRSPIAPPPADKLNGFEKKIFEERDRKLEEARERRALSRQGVACEAVA